MFPRIDERARVECANMAAHVVEFEQSRARWNQQADAELDRRDVFDQILLRYDREEIAVSRKSRPRREWHERRLEHQAELAETRHHRQKIGACVSLCQPREDGVIDRFDGVVTNRQPVSRSSRDAPRGAAGARS